MLSQSLAFYACTPLSCEAQMPRKGDGRYQEIDAEEGRKRLAYFRNQRLDGDYCFRFELEHLPRRGKAVRYTGTMWGTWSEAGPMTRLHLDVAADQGSTAEAVVIEYLFQNGPQPKAWLKNRETGSFDLLTGDLLMKPILEGIVYSPFDLQMPFIYWSDYDYEGPVRVKSRVAQTFLMHAPAEAEDAWAGSVRIGIDDVYNALLRIEVLETKDRMRSQFTIESFKKVQGQYIVKQVVLKDLATKDRTRFKVKQASVGLLLDDAWFDPDGSVHQPVIEDDQFQKL